MDGTKKKKKLPGDHSVMSTGYIHIEGREEITSTWVASGAIHLKCLIKESHLPAPTTGAASVSESTLHSRMPVK